MRYFENTQPAADAVYDLLTAPGAQPVMSVVNYSEVSWALAADLGIDSSHPDLEDLRELVDIESPGLAVAEMVSRLKRAWHMSLGDAYAAATALAHGAPVWSGDPELLTDDRIWLAHDLRSPQLRLQHTEAINAGKRKIGRRQAPDNDLARYSTQQLTAHILEPLAETDTPAPANPPLGL